tara:strand:+ start:382 stop:597 length:216 start_codon:yes stop_codon:yes gene_type:complete
MSKKELEMELEVLHQLEIEEAKMFLENFQKEYKQESKGKAFSTLHLIQDCLNYQEKTHFNILKEMKRLDIF